MKYPKKWRFKPLNLDLYHWLLVIPWPRFLLLVGSFYLSANALFALGYFWIGEGIANAQPGSYRDLFFFSVQTLSTVGYGSMYPETMPTQILVTFEIMVGLVLLAILTGLMFARFSRPTAKVVFSEVAVICHYNGLPTLMFRTANQRDNRILEAQVQVTMLKNEISPEGYHFRRFYDLQLLRSRTPVFGLSWSVMHPIDENSPLNNATYHSLIQLKAEIWVTLTGLDETFSQTIHTRHVYLVDHILWDMRFVDIFWEDSYGRVGIDLTRFHDVIPASKIPSSLLKEAKGRDREII
ncbi:ion channel [Gloeocapsa sp. PCC 73106]|uniref:ion channel n=1 Tax=Gloeocapsa sp. PCC 73106 TaxID=102232 RepID=UPI0002ACB360|nr:ion channel [Gloeocapsa sp. PCC 73106]ELR99516.1 Inward rectifier potassium channel [Gloeocapsa sp. PCC 73106]